jgi:hypothetical protein
MPDATFGSDIERISHAIDFISEMDLQRVYEACFSYVKRELRINKLELLREEPVDEGPGLKPILDTNDSYPAYPIRKSDGSPNGINAFSYLNDQKLWLTVPEGRDDKVLADLEASEYQEFWSSRRVNAEFTRLHSANRNHHHEMTKTIISIPIHSRRRCWGVAYFESSARLIPSGEVRLEFERIAKSLSRLCELWMQDSERRYRAAEVISDLVKTQDDYTFHFPYSLPLIFGIFPDQIDENVITAVKDAVKTIGRYEWKTWRELAQSGVIVSQIEAQLSQARYVIAYLSEGQRSSKDNQPLYTDNPNVLYELGMFRGLLRARSEPARGAIIIREQDSPVAPFDLLPYRRIDVPRSSAGSIDHEKLRQEVKRYIEALEDL